MHHPLKLYEDQMSQDRQSTKKPVGGAPRMVVPHIAAYYFSLWEDPLGSVGRGPHTPTQHPRDPCEATHHTVSCSANPSLIFFFQR
jgi:hypothetical protein